MQPLIKSSAIFTLNEGKTHKPVWGNSVGFLGARKSCEQIIIGRNIFLITMRFDTPVNDLPYKPQPIHVVSLAAMVL